MAPKQSSSSKSKVPLFLVKTFQMIDDQTTDSTIMWNKAGDGFIVVEEHLCAQKILPRYFRHSNFSSFVRQLNFYGFKKGFHEGASCEFKHPKFKRGHKELLKDIRRKTSESHANQKKVMEDLQRDFDELKRRNDQLWQFQRKMLYTIATFVRANRNDSTLTVPQGAGIAGFITSAPEEDSDGVSAVSSFSQASQRRPDDDPQDAWDLCHQIEQLAEQMPPSNPGAIAVGAVALSESSEWAQSGPSKPPLRPQPAASADPSSRDPSDSVSPGRGGSEPPSTIDSHLHSDYSRLPSQSRTTPHSLLSHGTAAAAADLSSGSGRARSRGRPQQPTDSPVVDFDDDDTPHIREGEPPAKRRRTLPASTHGRDHGALPSFGALGESSSIQRDGFEEVTDDLDSAVPNPSLITPLNAGFLSEDIGFPSSMFLSMPGNMPGSLPSFPFAADFDSSQLLSSHLDMSDPFGISSPSLSMPKLPELPPSLSGLTSASPAGPAASASRLPGPTGGQLASSAQSLHPVSGRAATPVSGLGL